MTRVFFILISLSIYSFSQCTYIKSATQQKAYCWDVKYKHTNKNKTLILVDVYGYPQNKPTVTFNHRYIKQISKKDITNRWKIVTHTRYTFSMNYNKTKGILRVKDNNIVKKTIQVNP